MTLSEIYFNYNEAIAQADALSEIAGKIKTAGGDLQTILNDVSSAWKSDSSNQYLTKGRKVGEDLSTTRTNLLNIANAIRSIAWTVREAELAAWRIANERL